VSTVTAGPRRNGVGWWHRCGATVRGTQQRGCHDEQHCPDPRFFAAPLPGEAAPHASTRATVDLYTPATVGWVAFFCGIPAGLVLSALNYRRMGDGGKAGAHLAGAAGVVATLIVSMALGPLGSVLSLALLVGSLVYLVRDTRAAAEGYQAAHPTADANGFVGFLIGLGVLIAIVAAYALLLAPFVG
jgi:hypothetical protein